MTARRGRPPKAYRTREWHVTLPEDIVARYELALWDAARNCPVRGARQEILSALLERLWQAVLEGNDGIFVGDVVANIRSHMQEPPQPQPQEPQP